MYEYDCCRCQKTHDESERDLYDAHLMYQSKHGYRWVCVEVAIERAAAVAHFAADGK